jgi:hypothetical protein
VRFARHLIAVLLTVAAIAALGVAWAHSSEAGWLAAPVPAAHRIQPSHLQLARRADAGSGLSLSDSGDLMRAALIEAAIAAVVVTVSAARRRRRAARRLPTS